MLGDATRLRVFGHSVSEAAPTNVRGLSEMSWVIATKLPWANQEWGGSGYCNHFRIAHLEKKLASIRL
jgi:hypothetical protein